MSLIALKLTGVTPLVTHNERLANPLDKGTRKLSALTHVRGGKSIEQIEQIARLEWELGQYRDDRGPVLPLANVRKCIVEAGRMSKTGKLIATALTFGDVGEAPLLYEGPRDLDKMWEARSFTDQRTAVVSGRRVLRCRPIFHGWSAVAKFDLDTKQVDPEKLVAAAQLAGRLVGLCEMRPAKGGFYGRFRAELVS
jgi:hypothetical protein